LLRSEMELSAMQQVAKVETPKEAETPKVGPIGPKIVMHSGVNCEPCHKWKREMMPHWKAQGWEVQVIEETQSDIEWPWFEICEGGKCYKVIGPLTAESYEKAKR